MRRRGTSRQWSLGRVLRLLRTTLLSLVFAAVAGSVLALVVVPKVAGAVPLTVLSGSMEPTISPGSVVVVRPVDAGKLRVGDVITYQLRSGDPTLVTHRIIGISAGTNEFTFTTRGDHNADADPDPVRDVQIRGKVWYRVPFIGHLTNRLDVNERGTATKVIAAGLLGWAAWMFAGAGIDRFRRRGRSNGEEPTEEATGAGTTGDDTPALIRPDDDISADMSERVGASP